jgi:hypothetical protein
MTYIPTINATCLDQSAMKSKHKKKSREAGYGVLESRQKFCYQKLHILRRSIITQHFKDQN